MDGGRGQVNIALGVLDKLGIRIPVCGMVKDDHHRTRGLYFDNIEIPIDTNSEGFRLITRIQDEAHRFAIEYHRSLRSKEQVHSVLDDKGTMFVWARIPGGRTDSMAFCMELMEKAGVIVTPGASFGPHGEGYVRFALVLPPEKIREVVEAIRKSGI